MGMAILNVWVRNEKCQVVEKRGHLHVYDCHGNPRLPVTWFSGGHIEVRVPPGCYIVTAGVVYGNVYTDKAMVLVRCGEEACVNLVLNRFREEKANPHAVLAKGGCAIRLMVPLVWNARKFKMAPDDLQIALDVIARAAGMDKAQVVAGIQSEIRELEENLEKFGDEEMADAKEYLSSLQQLPRLIG